MDRADPAPSVVVHIESRAFEHEGQVAKIRLPTDAPKVRSIVLRGVLLDHIGDVALHSEGHRISPVWLLSAASERREIRIDFWRKLGDGIHVMGLPVELMVVFAEGAPDRTSMRASVEFW